MSLAPGACGWEGTYRVVLHFSEVYFKQPGNRRFGVVIEGEKKLEAFDPSQPGGVNAAGVCFFEERVGDGVLDIEFLPDLDYPQIAAIEIERIR